MLTNIEVVLFLAYLHAHWARLFTCAVREKATTTTTATTTLEVGSGFRLRTATSGRNNNIIILAILIRNLEISGSLLKN